MDTPTPTTPSERSGVSGRRAFTLLSDFFKARGMDAEAASGEAIALMRALSGITLRFNLDVTERVAREERIVEAITRNPSSATIRRLSEHHGLTHQVLAKLYRARTGKLVTDLRRERAGGGRDQGDQGGREGGEGGGGGVTGAGGGARAARAG